MWGNNNPYNQGTNQNQGFGNNNNQGFNNNNNQGFNFNQTATFRCQSGSNEILQKHKNSFQTGNGQRLSKEDIKFNHSFQGTPQVIVSLSGLDCSKDYNTRLQIYAENITNQGFTLVIKTWGNSQFWQVKVNWMALGI